MNTDWLQDEVKVGAVTMHYVRTGGNKPVMVLAHGFSDNGMCWLPTAQALSADYDIILPDAVGHGLSSRVRPDQELDQPGDLAGLIQALKLTHPIVGGHSMGAGTAASLGARYPQLARALILEDPAWFERPDPPKKPQEKREGPDPWLEWLKSTKSQSTEAVMAYGRSNNPRWDEIEMRPWAEAKQQFDPNFSAARHPDERPDWRATVRAISVPTLLITAETEQGALITPAIAEAAADLNPHIQVAKIDNAGHNIRRENFPAYLAAIKAFLAEL